MGFQIKKKFSFQLWHRRVGLTVCILLIILAITGILLNHTEELELDSNFVDSNVLMRWYGLEPKTAPISYPVRSHQITQWGTQLFFDDKPIASAQPPLRGAVITKQFIAIVFEHEMLLLSHQGEQVERIHTATHFSNNMRIGLKYDRPVIEAANANIYMADNDIIDWHITPDEDIQWASTIKLNSQQMQNLRLAFRGRGLSWERVILDLHSGRLFGSLGIYVMDAAAIALLWLAGSGIWIWSSRRRNMKKRHYKKNYKK